MRHLFRYLWVYIALTASGNLWAQAEANYCITDTGQLISSVQTDAIHLVKGTNIVELTCSFVDTNILSLPMNGLHSVVIQSNQQTPLERQASHFYSVLIPSDTVRLTLNVSNQRARDYRLYIESVTRFNQRVTTHTITLFLFIGFCSGLALYVGLLGRGIKQSGFYAYSTYLFFAVAFFAFQEGLLNYFSPHTTWQNDVSYQSLLAGFVVFFATTFLTRLLDLKILLNRRFYQLILVSAGAVMVSGVVIFVFPESSQLGLSGFMAWTTLAIIFTLFIIAGYASIQRVNSAAIVFTALSIIFVAMLFRVALNDISDFMTRYALIISTAIESFLFAYAASEKVKYLEVEKAQAYLTASEDPLCSLMNRRGWEMAVERKIERFRKREGIFVLLFIDMNDFKQINDEHGHPFGDKVLKTFAKILRHKTREGDIIGRFGGDEFVVFAHALNPSQARRIEQRYRENLQQRDIWIDGQQLSISASVGGIIEEVEHAELSSMLQRADLDMYQQKTEAKAKIS
ncbi:diguanylate cyclase [Alteromonas facilis]|uniref:sensor domain-containing diguanylate cyclase n=1 Tax=Alteromonas facilis TaxID=2048004 RepID=UPI000C291463|nr:diguanylate cyclase [Alteromonas facilis]